jgi:hypothetical protein
LKGAWVTTVKLLLQFTSGIHHKNKKATSVDVVLIIFDK